MDSSYGPSDLGVLVADNQLEDACPPKESSPLKDGIQLKLPNLLDSGFDKDISPAEVAALCPDADYNMPLCCSGTFDGKNAGLCVQCMFVAIFIAVQRGLNSKTLMT